jgi:hypothetical protein
MTTIGFVGAHEVHAGVTATEASDCGSDIGKPENALHPLFGAILGNVPNARLDFIIRQPYGQSGRVLCNRDIRVHPFNDTESPAFGMAENADGSNQKEMGEGIAAFSRALGQFMVVRQAGPIPRFQCLSGLKCSLPKELQKSEGFQLRPSALGGLAGDGVYAFLQLVPPGNVPVQYRIPFVVQKARQGDWLEFSLQGRVFWKAQLSELKVDELYWVTVPEWPLEADLVVLGLYLNTGTVSDSVVYIPTVLNN